ncbi:MAG TPA: dephospho-CoA kinase [Chitinophagaceae bacterium]|nr:dephospho-CoA kinase [Chitinophagaceae bacterium]
MFQLKKPIKIGLTGGIGSGKTTVAKIFELLGVPVYYADAASKKLYHSDAELKQDMQKHFGEQIYKNEILDKGQLAAIVFNDEKKLALLNGLVHPRTIRDAEEWMERQTAPYVIKEAALIFEGGSASGLDFVIGVRAPKHLRIKRVMDRENISRNEVLTRMQRQIDEEIKMRLCDFVIVNDEQQAVIPQVLALHQKFLSDC